VRTLQPSPHQPDEVLFADDVVSFAQANGLWSPPSSSLSSNRKDDGDHSSFDISDVYDPVRWRCVCVCFLLVAGCLGGFLLSFLFVIWRKHHPQHHRHQRRWRCHRYPLKAPSSATLAYGACFSKSLTCAASLCSFATRAWTRRTGSAMGQELTWRVPTPHN
jgi:hypothetical protein